MSSLMDSEAHADVSDDDKNRLASAKDFLKFVDASPSPYHAVKTSIDLLDEAGFVRLREDEPEWDFSGGARGFYVTRFGTSIIAFMLPGVLQTDASSLSYSVIGAHTDSPCFKVKPVSAVTKENYVQVGVETYGGGLWYTWFDRDLTVAGRVVLSTSSSDGREGAESAPPASHTLRTVLVHPKRALLRVPSLAIHLNREANRNFSPNTETNLAPILATALHEQASGLKKGEAGDNPPDSAGGREENPSAGVQALSTSSTTKSRHSSELMKVLADELACQIADIVDLDLYVADTQPAALGGANNEFVLSPRLDNLASCFTALRALLDVQKSTSGAEAGHGDRAEADAPKSSAVRLVCMFDHEEVGSMSAQGAGSPFVTSVMRRIYNALDTGKSASPSSWESCLARSFLISADMAHAVHPNYGAKHELRHRPAMNSGVVIKTNQNQRYATNGYTGLVLRQLAREAGVPVQEFVVPNDQPCGSTIGPILAARSGVRTVDVGMPQLAMHSCREMCGSRDFDHAISLYKAFFTSFASFDSTARTSFQ